MNSDNIVQFVSDGFESAKKGNAVAIYDSVASLHDKESLPLKSHYPFGWIIYYALHQSPDSDILVRKKMLARYLSLKLKVPHKLHSMILTEAIRLYKDAANASFGHRHDNAQLFSILRFAGIWNLENLRPGDWKRKEFEGKQLSSTAEKLITIIVDELTSSNTPADPAFVKVVDQAITMYPDSYELLSQRASLHSLAGETEEARRLLRNAILLAPGKFFLWSRLAQLTDSNENARLHVALLYRALKAPGQPQFKGRIHLLLAKVLMEKNLSREALWELNIVETLYNTNGWHMPALHESLRSKIAEQTEAADPEHLYRKIAHLADDEIYAALSPITTSKTFHKLPDPSKSSGYGKPAVAWRLTADNGENHWIQPHRFGIHPDLPMGTKIALRLFNGKPVKADVISD